MLTVYHEPAKAIAARTATIVLGSTAAGTMSPVSKIVFADGSKATAFAESCGGEAVSYPTALEVAKASVIKENQMSLQKKLKKGKIVEPTDTDRCPVCGMLPARYPYNKCQIQTRDKRVMHFCSSQCIFAFLDEPARYADAKVEPFLIWVVDRATGMWVGARAAYFVIGSQKVFGPMGYEAFPFNSLDDAKIFAAENGGKAVIFGGVTIEKIVPEWNFTTPGKG
jgi:nitrous oxide reductase accessory protein NosL